jgi:hypothetical protein
MGLDTKIYWLTDRQSQCDFDFDFDFTTREFSAGARHGQSSGGDRHGRFSCEEELQAIYQSGVY